MFVMLTLPGLDLVNRLPLWLTVLVISRDVAIVLTVAVVNLAVARRTFRPSLLGKAATVDLRRHRRASRSIANYLRVHSIIVTIAIWASLAVTLASGSTTSPRHARRALTSATAVATAGQPRRRPGCGQA